MHPGRTKNRALMSAAGRAAVATGTTEWYVSLPRAWRSTLMVAVFLLLASVNAYRTASDLVIQGDPYAARSGLGDFRNNVYYPVRCFLDGRNPYDRAQNQLYPTSSPTFPPYSPLTLLLHLPFALLPFAASELVYYLMTLGFTLLIAVLALRFSGLVPTVASIFGLGSLILLSRPGQMTLLTGQTTATLVLGFYMALLFAHDRPWLAGLGLAMSTIKPSFGVPLFLLMLVRKDLRAVAYGTIVGGVPTLGVTTVLAHRAGGLLPLLALLPANYQRWNENAVGLANAATSVLRVDAVSFLSRLVGPLGTSLQLAITFGILAAAAVGIRQLGQRHEDGARRLSASIMCLATLTCTYHQTYDLLLLCMPLTALATVPVAPRGAASQRLRWGLFIILLIPMFNYLVSFPAQRRLGVHGATLFALLSLNSGCLVAALLVFVLVARRRVSHVLDA